MPSGKTADETSTVADEPASDARICGLTSKVPAFWPRNPKGWFRRVEALFKTSNITTEMTKYTHLISALDEEYASVIDDILDDLDNDGKYTRVKEALIQRLSDSDSQRIQKLLAPLQMGDQAPSQLLRKMKTIAGDLKVTDDLLKSLWLSRLPSDTQRMLATVSDDRTLNDLADTADRIHNVSPSGGQIAAVAASEPSSDLEKILKKLENIDSRVRRIEQQNSQNRGRSQRRSQTPARSASRKREDVDGDKELCWYHFKFGEKSTKCREPCNWSSKN